MMDDLDRDVCEDIARVIREAFKNDPRFSIVEETRLDPDIRFAVGHFALRHRPTIIVKWLDR